MIARPTKAHRLVRLFSNIVQELVLGHTLLDPSHDGLSPAQFAGLRFVHLHPSCCIKDVADALSVSHPAAIKLLERIQEKGLITRSRAEYDRRVVQLKTTQDGGRFVNAITKQRNEIVQQMLNELGEETSERLLECLDKCVQAALADEKTIQSICLHCGKFHENECPVQRGRTAVEQRTQ